MGRFGVCPFLFYGECSCFLCRCYLFWFLCT